MLKFRLQNLLYILPIAIISFFLVSSNWLILPIGAFVWLAVQLFQSKKNLLPALLSGAFLASFDWVIENLGSIFGYWQSVNSNFFLILVPFEVTLAAFLSGTALILLLKPIKMNMKSRLVLSVVLAVGGALGEFFLTQYDLLQYLNGWTSIHAFFAYLITWLLFFWFYNKVQRILR